MPMSKPKRRAKSKSATSIVKPETKVEIPKEILVEFVESKVKLKEIKFMNL